MKLNKVEIFMLTRLKLMKSSPEGDSSDGKSKKLHLLIGGVAFVIMFAITAYCWSTNSCSLWGWSAGLLGVLVASQDKRALLSSIVGAISGVALAYVLGFLVWGSNLQTTEFLAQLVSGVAMCTCFLLAGAVLGKVLALPFQSPLGENKRDNSYKAPPRQ